MSATEEFVERLWAFATRDVSRVAVLVIVVAGISVATRWVARWVEGHEEVAAAGAIVLEDRKVRELPAFRELSAKVDALPAAISEELLARVAELVQEHERRPHHPGAAPLAELQQIEGTMRELIEELRRRPP